jgi:hypothetical protein
LSVLLQFTDSDYLPLGILDLDSDYLPLGILDLDSDYLPLGIFKLFLLMHGQLLKSLYFTQLV